MSNNFDEYAGLYDRWFLENSNVLYSELKLVAHFLDKAGDVLSVGCGSGLFESLLQKEYGIIIRKGIEPSTGMADIARKRGMDVRIATAETHDFGISQYDTILYNGTPSYISDLGEAFRKTYDALRPGGKVIVIDIPKESSYGILYNLAKALGTWEHELLKNIHPKDPYPIEFVNIAKWRTTAEKVALLEKMGFCQIQFAQTLLSHPLYSNNSIQEPVEGFDKGDYVAICGYKKK
jgi:trans-aconitate methyltransferase